MDRMRDVKLGEIRSPESGGKIRRGSPRMRWEDCIMRDLKRLGGELITTAKDRSSMETVDRERSERKGT